MDREQSKQHNLSSNASTAERIVAFIFALPILVTFIILVLNPRTMDSGTLAVVRFLATTFAGISGYLFSGQLGLEAKMPLNKTQIRATGAFAAFVLVFFLFFVGVPSSETSSGGSNFISQFSEEETSILHEDSQDLICRGFRAENQGDYREAMNLYSQAIQIDANAATTWQLRGIIRWDQQDYRGAIDDFSRAIDLDPNFDVAYSLRGLTHLDAGLFQNALEDYDRAIYINSNSDMYYNNRGIIKYELGDLQGAIDDFTEALELSSNSDDAILLNRGSVYLDLDAENHGRALEDFNLAAEIANNSGHNDHYREALDLIEPLQASNSLPIKQTQIIWRTRQTPECSD